MREDRRICQKEIATISTIGSLVYCGDNEDEDEEEEEKKHGEEKVEDENDDEDEEEEEPVWTCAKSSTRVFLRGAVDQFTARPVVIEAGTTCRGS